MYPLVKSTKTVQKVRQVIPNDIWRKIHHAKTKGPNRRNDYSQRDLAYKLQLAGYDMDKNVITRIETNKRYVTDLELKALSEIFQVSYDCLIDGVFSTDDKN